MMYKRIIQIFIISLLIFSCKKKIVIENDTASFNTKSQHVEATSCQDLFIKLVHSSTFDTKGVTWDKTSILIDNFTNSSISGKIDFLDSGNLSGYVKLDLTSFKLYSISSYTGEEKVIEYDKSFKAAIRNICLSEKTDQIQTKKTNSFGLPFSLETIHHFEEISNLQEKDYVKIKDVITTNEPSNSELSNIYKIENNKSFDTYVYIVEGDEVFSVLVNIDKDGKVISSRELHYESPKEQEFFILDENLIASIFKIENNTEKTLVEKIKVNENGTISQILNNRKKVNPTEFKAPN